MCGRYVNVASTADLVSEFDAITPNGAAPNGAAPNGAAPDGATPDGATPAPSWNVAPTDPVPIIVERARTTDGGEAEPRREVRTARWGLVPSWSRDRTGGARMINARIETVTKKPAFSAAAARRRCLVPALGYYEWQQTPHGKVPHFLHHPDGELLAMAGLYELWRDPDRADDDPQRWLLSCTIITQQATDLLGQIHDRNPVVVPRELRASWLDCTAADVTVAEDLLERMPPAHLATHVVSSRVGNVRNNGPELIEPVSDQQTPAAVRLDPDPDQLTFTP